MRVTNAPDALPSLNASLRNDEATGPRGRTARTPDAQPAPEATAQVDVERLKEAVETANRALEKRAAEMEFAMDSDSGRVVVKLIDRDTRKVLRQFPSEEMLRISKYIEEMQSVGIEQKA